MQKTFILLPPSEGKIKGGDFPYKSVKDKHYFKNLNPTREKLYNELINNIKKLEKKELEKIFGVKEKNLEEVLKLKNNFFEEKTVNSIKRFDGVMFKAINYNSLNKKQKENFNNLILFIDGLFGLLKPLDPIPNYKLPIGSKINNIKIDKFWKNELENLFTNLFENSILIDILPQSHKKVLTIPKSTQIYSIIFAQLKNNKLKQTGHFSKQLKGELIRYLINQKNINRKILEDFNHTDGYSYSKEHSKKNLIVYLKN